MLKRRIWTNIATALALQIGVTFVCRAESPLEAIVVTASRADATLADTAASVSLVSTSELENITAEHISQAFHRVPGTWISRGNGQEHLTAIRSPVFTGPGACGAFLMSQDGIPVRASGFCNANQLFDTHFEAADRIEVYRGPNSAIHGGNALFGGINLSLPGPAGNSAAAMAQLGEYDYQRIHYDQSFVLDQQALRMFVTGAHDGGYRESSGYRQWKLSLKHQWEDDNLLVTNSVSFTDLDQQTAGFIEGEDAYKDKALRRSNPNPDAYRETRSLRAYSRWRWQLAGGGEWSLTPYFRSNEMEFLMHFVPWQPVERNEHRSLGMQSLWRKPLSPAFEYFWGMDIETTRAALREIQEDEAPFSSAVFPVGVHYDYRVDARYLAGYLGIKWRPQDRFSIEAALRYDNDRYDYTNRAADGSACAAGVDNCRFFRPADSVDTFESNSGKVGAVYKVVETFYLFANAGRSYRAPQATELYRLEQEQSRAALDSVKLRGVDVGVRGEIRGYFYQVSAFDMKQTNGIFQNGERHYISGAETSHRGIEYEFSGALADALSLRLSGTYAKHRYENNPDLLETQTLIKDNEIDTAPRNMNALVLEWRTFANTDIELEWTQMGSYYTDPENGFNYPGHRLLNLRGFYRIADNLKLSLAITNLTDAAYAERADVSFGQPRYFPGEGRKVVVGVRWEI